VFDWLQREAGLPETEMLRTFNCGVGLIAVVDKTKAASAVEAFNANGERAFVIGALAPAQDAEPVVRYRGTLAA
jgi:phosphoribosylformylglycinamidine cyclo-ligase